MKQISQQNRTHCATPKKPRHHAAVTFTSEHRWKPSVRWIWKIWEHHLHWRRASVTEPSPQTSPSVLLQLLAGWSLISSTDGFGWGNMRVMIKMLQLSVCQGQGRQRIHFSLQHFGIRSFSHRGPQTDWAALFFFNFLLHYLTLEPHDSTRRYLVVPPTRLLNIIMEEVEGVHENITAQIIGLNGWIKSPRMAGNMKRLHAN